MLTVEIRRMVASLKKLHSSENTWKVTNKTSLKLLKSKIIIDYYEHVRKYRMMAYNCRRVVRAGLLEAMTFGSRFEEREVGAMPKKLGEHFPGIGKRKPKVSKMGKILAYSINRGSRRHRSLTDHWKSEKKLILSRNQIRQGIVSEGVWTVSWV